MDGSHMDVNRPSGKGLCLKPVNEEVGEGSVPC